MEDDFGIKFSLGYVGEIVRSLDFNYGSPRPKYRKADENPEEVLKIPFDVELPMAPDSINAKNMTASDIRNALKAGEEDIKHGRYINAKDIKKKGL